MPKFDDKNIRVNRFSYWLSRMILKLIGWKAESFPPDIKKAVVIVAPHTSNWDFIIGLILSYKLRLKGFWIGKHTLFKKPFGFIFYGLGGVPVDRRSPQNLVEQITEVINQREEFLLVLAPEGTRKRIDKWKTGFYYIAKNANVPIICAFLDFKKKAGGAGPVIYPSDDFKGDMEKIRAFYLTVNAKIPEHVGNMEF